MNSTRTYDDRNAMSDRSDSVSDPNLPAGVESELDPGALRITGIVALIVGTLAVIFPFAASIGVGILTGALLIVLGVTELVRAFRQRRTGRVITTTLFGILALVTGTLFLVSPAVGVLSLTFLLIAYFLAAGVFRVVTSWQFRVGNGRWWVFTSGVLSIVLGAVLLFALPGAATWALGLLFGIDSIFFGAAALAAASTLSKRQSA